jgi:hypothetical protein
MDEVMRTGTIEKCPDCGRDIYYMVNSNNARKGQKAKPTAFDKGTYHIHKVTCGTEPRMDFGKQNSTTQRSSVRWT